MVQEDLYQRIVKVETIVENHTKKLEAQSEKNETLTKLTLLIEQQAEFNKDYKQELKEFRLTLNQVNDNLTELNASQKQMKQDMGQIGQRVSSIESRQEDSKIDVPTITTKIIVGLFMAIPTLITLWIALQLGLK